MSKAAPAKTSVSSSAPPAQTPKIVGPGAGILVPGLAAQTAVEAAPPDHGSFGAEALAAERGQRQRQESWRQPSTRETAESKSFSTPAAQEKAAHDKSKSSQGAPSGQQKTRTTHDSGRHPKPLREPKRPPTPPVELTDEIREKAQARYLELAQPVEFDGIRTQIAKELGVPKLLIKRAVAELRTKMQLPSWWELRSYRGSENDLARIRDLYLPLLPTPPVGVHKQLANQLNLDPVLVYQGIRRIRAELRLPQYNPPELHKEEATPAQGADVSDLAISAAHEVG